MKNFPKILSVCWFWLLLGVLVVTLVTWMLKTSPVDSRLRLAVVIGNQSYQDTDLNLDNPERDAEAMAQILTQLGFETQLELNQTRFELATSLGRFMQKARRYKRQGREVVTLVYYAGHGIQYDSVNYLVPVDTQLMSEPIIDGDMVREQLFSLKFITDSIATLEADLNLVILDACRDLPIAELAGQVGGWADIVQKDFFVAFGTAPGAKAFDSAKRLSTNESSEENEESQHGLYTQALLEQLAEPDLSLGALFQRVRTRVIAASDSMQIPQESNQARSDLIFNPSPRWHGHRMSIAFAFILALVGMVWFRRNQELSIFTKITTTEMGQGHSIWLYDHGKDQALAQIGNEPVTIGRSESNRVVLPDAERLISRQQCRIHQGSKGQGFYLEDISNGGNGIYIKRWGRSFRLKPGKRYPLNLNKAFSLVAPEGQPQARTMT